jgi:hypothetical protein
LDKSIMRVRVKSVKEAGLADVYCLYVPEHHNFAVGERGFFISNCDALRYGIFDILGQPPQTIKAGGLTLTHSLFEETKHPGQQPTFHNNLTRQMA